MTGDEQAHAGGLGPGGEPKALPFDVKAAQTGHVLTMASPRAGSVVSVDELVLEIPELGSEAPPGHPDAYQRRRGRLTLAQLSLDEARADAMIWERAAELGAAGFDDVRVRLLEGALELTGRARVDDRAADLTARVLVEPIGARIRLAIAGARLFGPLRRPAPLVAHDLVAVLLDLPPTGIDEPARNPFAEVLGLGDIVLAPLEASLWSLFPPSGWRLPDAGRLTVARVELKRGRAVVAWEAGAQAPRSTRRDPALEALGQLRGADGRLFAGDLDGASTAYRAELARRGQDAPILFERLLSVLCAREATHREADDLAREALGRWPDFAPAHLALAALAAERSRHLEAADHFARAMELAASAGDDEDAVRAALGAARRLRDVAPERATPFYQRVLERRPAHTEAAEALIERYAAEGRWPELVVIARRRIAATEDPRERAREHVRLGETFLVRMDDAAQAKIELDRATQLDEADGRAWDGLGRALAALGEHEAAINALAKLARLQEAKGDVVGEGRTHARIGALWELRGDLTTALARSRRAHELLGDDPEVLERVARLASKTGRLADARADYTRLLELVGADPPRRRATEHALGLVNLELGELDEARRHLERGADESEGSLVALAKLEERAGRPAEALAHLHTAAARCESPTDAAALEVWRARLARDLGEERLAREAWESALSLAPDAPSGMEAAIALATAARRRGDAAEEARWLDVLLERPGAPPRADLVLRRGHLHLALGDPDAARGLLERARAAGAPERDALRLEADVRGAAGDEEGRATALEAVGKAEVDDEDAAAAFLEAARARLGRDDTAALAAAVRADELRPGDVATLTVLVDAAWRTRAWEVLGRALPKLVDDAPAKDVPELARRLGLTCERVGDFHGAENAYRRVTSSPEAAGDPLATSWKRLAELAERVGDYAGASTALREAAADARTGSSSVARAELLHRAAELKWKYLSDLAGARELSEAALREAPDYLPALDALETLASEAGDLEAVAAVLGRKIRATSRFPERQKVLLVRLAELQAGALGRPDVAREGYRRALELDPELRPALRYLAPDAKRRGELDDAAQLYARLARRGQANAPGGAVPEGEREERSHALAALASIEHQRGHLAEATALLEEATTLELTPGPARGLLERLYEEGGRYGDLAASLRALAHATSDPQTRLGLEARRVRILADHIDRRAAIEAALGLVARAPADAALTVLALETATTLEVPSERRAALERLATLTTLPASAERALREAALAAELQGDPAAAETLRTRAAAEGSRVTAPDDAPTNVLPSLASDTSAPPAAPDAAPTEVTPELTTPIATGPVHATPVGEATPTEEARALLSRIHASPSAANAEELLRDAARLAPQLEAERHAAAAAIANAHGDLDAEATALLARRQLGATTVDELRRLAALRAGAADPPTPLTLLEEALSRALAGASGDLPAEVPLRAPLDELGSVGRAAERLGSLADTLVARADEARVDGVAAILYAQAADWRLELGRGAEAELAALAALQRAPGEPATLAAADDVFRRTGNATILADKLVALAADRPGPLRATLLTRAATLPGIAASDARDRLTQALAAAPDHADALLALGALDADEGRTAEATELLARGIERVGDTPAAGAAWARLAELAYVAGAHGTAETRLARAIALAPDDARARRLKAELAGDTVVPLPTERSTGRADLDLLLQAKRYAEVVATLDAEARDAPPPVAAGLAAEASRIAAGPLRDPEGAITRLGIAIGFTTDVDARARLAAERAELLARMGRPREAEADLVIARTLEEQPGAAHLARARLELAIDHPEAALPHLRAAHASPDLDAGRRLEALLLDAQIHEDLGEPTRSKRLLEVALDVAPDDVRVLGALLHLAEVAEDYELLVELVGKQIALTSDRVQRARLWYKRGLIARDLLGKQDAALEWFREASSFDPTFTPVSQALRELATQSGEWELVAELLHRELAAATTPSEKADLYLQLARVHEDHRADLEAAARNLEAAQLLAPARFDATAALARVLGALGRSHDAALAGEAAADLAPDDAIKADQLLRAASHFAALDRPAEARRVLARAATLAAGGEAAAAARAELEREATPVPLDAGPHSDVHGLKQLLAGAVDSGLDDEVIDARARAVLERAPGDLDAYLERRRIREVEGDWQGLAELIRARAEALTSPRERASLFHELGLLHGRRLGDPVRAAINLELALVADPAHAPSLDALADLSYLRLEWDRARELYRQLDPETSVQGVDVVMFRRAELEEMAGNEEVAERAYMAATQRDPSLVAAWEALARLARARGDLTSAIAALRMVAERTPRAEITRLTELRLELGELNLKAGDLQAAEESLDLVLVERPNDHATLELLLAVYVQVGDHRKCVETLERLSRLEGDPTRKAELLARAGDVYRLQLGDDDMAAETYLKAIDLDPEHIPTLRHLVEFYWRQGDDQAVAEIASQLETQDALVGEATPPDTLARIAVAAALAGDLARAEALVKALGPAGAGAIATSLAEAAHHRPDARTRLAEIARTICVAPGPNLDAVRAVLVMRGMHDPTAETLANQL